MNYFLTSPPPTDRAVHGSRGLFTDMNCSPPSPLSTDEGMVGGCRGLFTDMNYFRTSPPSADRAAHGCRGVFIDMSCFLINFPET